MAFKKSKKMHNFPRKLKILLIHPHDILDKSEPWTVRILNIAGRFCKRGHKVKLLYFTVDYNKAHQTHYLDKDFQTIGLDRRCGTVNFIRNIIKISKFVEWADVVHFQKCFHYASIPVIFSCFIKRKPVHYDWDDWETQIYHYGEPASRLIGIFMYLLERIIPKVVDSVSYSSDKLRELSLHYGVSSNRLAKASVGADLNIFHPQNNGDNIKKKFNITKPIILYLGQLHGAQYAELFIQAAKIITDRYPYIEVTFMVVGGGCRLTELEKLVLKLKLTNSLIFTNFLSHKEVPEYIAASSICVACFEENNITICKSPLKIAEYLASGKPIIASCVGEVRNMIGGVGLLVEPGSSLALANGIVKVLNNPELAKKMSRLARERAEKGYNWEETTENILSLYKKIIRR